MPSTTVESVDIIFEGYSFLDNSIKLRIGGVSCWCEDLGSDTFSAPGGMIIYGWQIKDLPLDYKLDLGMGLSDWNGLHQGNILPLF
jgi:hypothetical protein